MGLSQSNQCLECTRSDWNDIDFAILVVAIEGLSLIGVIFQNQRFSVITQIRMDIPLRIGDVFAQELYRQVF